VPTSARLCAYNCRKSVRDTTVRDGAGMLIQSYEHGTRMARLRYLWLR
jgi:hypothetical protein